MHTKGCTVVDLPTHIAQRIPRHLWLLLEEHAEHLHTRLQIAVVELVGFVPTQWAELLTFLHNGVEETQTCTVANNKHNESSDTKSLEKKKILQERN